MHVHHGVLINRHFFFNVLKAYTATCMLKELFATYVISTVFTFTLAFPDSSVGKESKAWETPVRFLDQEDLLKKG